MILKAAIFELKKMSGNSKVNFILFSRNMQLLRQELGLRNMGEAIPKPWKW